MASAGCRSGEEGQRAKIWSHDLSALQVESLSMPGDSPMKTKAGTPYYVAPQVDAVVEMSSVAETLNEQTTLCHPQGELGVLESAPIYHIITEAWASYPCLELVKNKQTSQSVGCRFKHWPSLSNVSTILCFDITKVKKPRSKPNEHKTQVEMSKRQMGVLSCDHSYIRTSHVLLEQAPCSKFRLT